MITALRIEINAIAACILVILILNKRRIGKKMLDERLYQMLLYTTLLYAVTDTVAWVLDGTQFEYMRFGLYASNILCYLFCVIIPYIWLLYAEIRLFEDEQRLWKINRFFAPPVVIYSMLVISTPITGWIFSFNEQQMYQREPLFLIQVVLSLGYIMFPTIRAILHLRKTSLPSERQECYNIAGFIILPLIGVCVQVLYYGIPAGIITTVIAEFIVFINLQNKQISLDALTSLNNRGQLNRYLGIETKKEFQHKKMYMLLLDIDRFKLINDTYGHKVGDQALIDMANILQRVCGHHGGFLSRYGGDEFAIIIQKKSITEIEQLIKDVHTEVRNFNDSGKRQYKLSTSIGYAVFGTEGIKTVDQLIEAADNQMYQMKIKRHTQMDQILEPIPTK